jgi:hypothetical protein
MALTIDGSSTRISLGFKISQNFSVVISIDFVVGFGTRLTYKAKSTIWLIWCNVFIFSRF